uniref:Uncharacterized protein n=1 Tax=Timema bartmani TaxID=61472 RepID=A0A7R9I231_9NEOP|nr:unnamed protein product [Timema bartmani]
MGCVGCRTPAGVNPCLGAQDSCFQLVGRESYDLNDMQSLLQDPNNSELDQIYIKYNVQAVQRCALTIAKAEASWTQLWVLVLAAFIGIAAFGAGITTCCLYSGDATKRINEAAEKKDMVGFIAAQIMLEGVEKSMGEEYEKKLHADAVQKTVEK